MSKATKAKNKKANMAGVEAAKGEAIDKAIAAATLVAATEDSPPLNAKTAEADAAARAFAPIKLPSVEMALRSRIGGVITVRVDGDDVVATSVHREARTPHAGRSTQDVYEALAKGLGLCTQDVYEALAKGLGL